MIAASILEQPLPADTETRLAGFTELVATAIANAEAHAQLTASRARIVATADETRRRIERDLHDGAQQRLVSLALRLRVAQATMPPQHELAAELEQVAAGLTSTLEELRDYARGIHPAILAEGGLGAALKTLARRSPVPVELDVRTTTRLPERIEVTAYYVVAEALTNVAKHANASVAQVTVDAVHDLVRVSVSDDGIGGADPTRGSGLVGLNDRIEATGGTLTLHSCPGHGTRLIVELPADSAELSTFN
jgi:signal transduction histidine kinase